MGRHWIVGIAIAACFDAAALAQEHHCPEGQVWGGTKCVWKELCPNGRPAYYGPCDQEPTPPPPPPPCDSGSSERPCTREKQETPTPPPIPPHDSTVVAQGCYGEIKFDSSKEREANRGKGIRRVVLVGGNAADLLDSYAAETSAKKVKMNLENLTVFYFEPSTNEPKTLRGGADVKVTTTDFFNYRSIQTVWRNRLRDVIAAERPNPEQDALRLGADLVCGSAKRK